jgi:hypothetical protein
MPTKTTNDLAALFSSPDAPSEPLIAAARHYLAKRQVVERQEEALGAAKEEKDRAETELLRLLDQAKTLSVKIQVDGGPPVMVTSATHRYYRAPTGAADDNDFLLWLLRSGGHDLVKRTINPQSFTAFCRELREQERPLHSRVHLTEIQRVSVTKS